MLLLHQGSRQQLLHSVSVCPFLNIFALFVFLKEHISIFHDENCFDSLLWGGRPPRGGGGGGGGGGVGGVWVWFVI
jgi:hypothetical protein